jgi:hypothetical protein
VRWLNAAGDLALNIKCRYTGKEYLMGQFGGALVEAYVPSLNAKLFAAIEELFHLAGGRIGK